MATRFYLTTFDMTSPAQSPAVSATPDSNWEQTGGATLTRRLDRKGVSDVLYTLGDTSAITIPITTTQDILGLQFVSLPIPPQILTGTVSLVIRCSENATTNNATLATVIRVVSQTGAVRSTLFSVFGTGTEYALTASSATRIVSAQAITATTTQPGDRLVVELGTRATGPTAAGSFIMRYGNNATSDFALTEGLTTDLNPWVEFSQDIWDNDLNNYQFARAGGNMSLSRG